MLDWIVPGSGLEAVLVTFIFCAPVLAVFCGTCWVMSGGLSEFIADWNHQKMVAEAEFARIQKKEARMNRKQYRQGDVWIREVLKPAARGWSEMAKKNAGKVLDAAVNIIPRDKGRVVLAYGEVTGHAHAIMDKTTEFFQCDDGRRILLVKDDETKLSHEEHGTVTIPKGEYEIIQQREYDPELHSRQVID